MKVSKALVLGPAISALLFSADAQAATKWAAAWATSMQAALTSPPAEAATVYAYNPQPDLSIPLPNASANNQTFRTIIKPELWGGVSRIKLSNAFGTQAVRFGDVSLALQDVQASIVGGTASTVTFNGGSKSIKLAPGEEIYSDAITLKFVGDVDPQSLAGRNLAVSYSVAGLSGPLTYHNAAYSTNYISAPNSGNKTEATDAGAFPYTTTSTFFLSEYDVQASSDVKVIVAFGDSITDGTFSTFNGYDRWANVMSDALHKIYGNTISVVIEGIAGNKVVQDGAGPSAINRLARDVLGLSGVNDVVWLEGINDLGQGADPSQVIAGYQTVVHELQAKGIKVVGVTLTSAYPPNGQVPSNSPLAAISVQIAAGYASAQTNANRLQVNSFILSSHLYNSTIDFATLTTDPTTGSIYSQFAPNSEGSGPDYLHPNRAGYQAMGVAAAQGVVGLLGR